MAGERAGRAVSRPPEYGQPTLEMVAAEAGVSRSTVSRVVNGSPKVRPGVADVVNQAIHRLNYVPNRAARSLASRQAHAIALVVPEDTSRFFGDPFFASVITGITSRLESSDYLLNLLVASSDPNRKTRRYLRSGSVDGALIISHHAGDWDLAELGATLPVVFGGRPAVRDPGACAWVDVDNLGGARAATRHLIARGARRIATVTGPPDMPAAIDRLRGWREEMRAAGLADDAVADGDFRQSGAVRATRELLGRHPDVDAVFAGSDLMARGVLRSLEAAGRRVPDDVAVVGFDDSPVATGEEPLLTTVAQPSIAMGARMADLLLQLLSGAAPDPGGEVLPTELVLRDTA